MYSCRSTSEGLGTGHRSDKGEDSGTEDSMFNSILMSQIFSKAISPRKEVVEDHADYSLKVNLMDNDSRIISGHQFPFHLLFQESLHLIDLTLVVDSCSIGVHQLILAAHSELLADLLQNIEVEGAEQAFLVLPSFSMGVVTKVVNFLYSGELVYEAGDLKEMKELVNLLKLRFLSVKLNELLLDITPSENTSTRQTNLLNPRTNLLNPQTHHEKSANVNISKDVEPSVTKSGRPESEKAGFLESSEKKDSSYLVTREEKDSSYLVTREAKHPRYLVTPPNKAGFSDHTDYNSRGTVQQETTNAVLGESETKNTDRLETFQPPSGFVDSGEQIISFSGLDDSCEIVIGCDDGGSVLLASGDQILLLDRDLETPIQSPIRPTEGPTVSPARHEQEVDAAHASDILNDLAIELTSQLNQLKTVEQQTVFQCAQCDQLFVTGDCLKAHTEQDHPELNFQCEWCKKHFISKATLDEHQKTAHPDLNGYSCDICGKKYTRNHQLKIHKRAHEGKKPYQCEVCKKKFTDNSRLKAHVKIHTDEYAYKCTVCGKAFKQRRTLRQHALTHSSDRPYKCSVCDKGFTFKRNMLRHTEIHTQVNLSIKNQNQVLKCSHCLNSYTTELALLEHSREAHPGTAADMARSLLFKCWMRNCGKVFPSKELLNSHFQIVHETGFATETVLASRANAASTTGQGSSSSLLNSAGEPRLETIAESTGDPNLESTGDPNLESTGDPNLESSRDLNLESTRDPNLESTRDPNLESSRDPNLESTGDLNLESTRDPNLESTGDPNLESTRDLNLESTRDPNLESTRDPNLEYTFPASNQNPLTSQGGEDGPYVCSCGVTFANARTLRQHHKTSHTAVGPFKCTLCAKAFKNDCDLRRHILDHTDAGKRHICNYCSKAWERPSDLAKHIRVHTGEKPYKCTECEARFADNSMLKRHERTKHGNSIRYSCEKCPKTFQVYKNLEKHLLTHMKIMVIQCSVCSKEFQDEVSLQAHINLHNGGLPYSCPYCSLTFRQLADMKKHERVHTKEKPYSCTVCGTKFSDASAFRRHEKKHLKVTQENTTLVCLGCNLNFAKEVVFFKHAGTIQSNSNTQCKGKPCEDDISEELFATPPRCLHCKETFTKADELAKHLRKENCLGPIYVRKVVVKPGEKTEAPAVPEPAPDPAAFENAEWIIS